MSSVRILAPAKLNLGLEVIDRRPDGFHEIATIFQTIDLADIITVSDSDELIVDVDDPALKTESNLALKAARALRARTSVAKGARIHLHKQIPSAAGLGGASSDAAATLRALTMLWRIEPTREALIEIASDLGSDVPFFVTGGTAVGRGRGELVERLSEQLSAWAVIVVPKLEMANKTAAMFGKLAEGDFSSGRTVLALRDRIEVGDSIVGEVLPNAFQRSAFFVWPELETLSKQFEDAGARGVSLSGAGPSLFTLVASENEATLIQDRLRALVSSKVHVFTCRTISQTPPPVRDNR